jgi:hypothetical protein
VFRVRVLLLLVVALALTSCRAAVDVSIAVSENGSGAVAVTAHFDDEAKAKLGGDLAKALHTDDLRSSGWTVTTPAHQGGEWLVTATKPFGSPAGLQSVLDDVGGKRGVFRDWMLKVSAGFGSTSWTIDGRVVLTGSLDQFGDSQLTTSLGGLPLGRTPEQLQAELGANGSIPFTVRVSLPTSVGSHDTNGSAPSFPAATVSWAYKVPGKAVDDRLHAHASSGNAEAYLWFGLAVVALLAAVSFWIFSRSRNRARR